MKSVLKDLGNLLLIAIIILLGIVAIAVFGVVFAVLITGMVFGSGIAVVLFLVWLIPALLETGLGIAILLISFCLAAFATMSLLDKLLCRLNILLEES